MGATQTKVHFQPAHGLDMRATRIIAEHEHPAQRWPEVTRVVTLYVDTEDHAAAFVCFRPPTHSGHVDMVRCYRGRIGPADQIGDPLAAVGGFEALADQVEDRFVAKLVMFLGQPGQPEPDSWRAQ